MNPPGAVPGDGVAQRAPLATEHVRPNAEDGGAQARSVERVDADETDPDRAGSPRDAMEPYVAEQNPVGGPSLRPIGHVRGTRIDPPHPRHWNELVSRIVMDPAIGAGLTGLEMFSHAFVVYWMHEVDTCGLFHECANGPRLGIVASRCSRRPNALGLTVVEIVELDGNELTVRGLDAYDGIPVLDVKPCASGLYAVPDATDLRSG